MLSVNWTFPVNRAHPLNRGLVSWWLNTPHGRGGLTFRDLVGQNDGTLTNMDPATDWVPASDRRSGWGALDFDGIDDFVLVGNRSILRPSVAFTYSLWVKRQGNGLGTNPHIMRWHEANGSAIGEPFLIQRGTDEFMWGRVKVAAGNVNVIDNTAIPLDVWTHYSLTHDGVNARLFRNGGLAAGPTAASGNLIYDADFLNFGGANLVASTERFDGQIDDVRIYRRALSAPEFRELYDLSRTGYGDLLNRRRMVFAVPAVGGASTIVADTAAYTYTAAAAGLSVQRQIVAGTAAYAYTANDVTLTVQRKIAADTAAYTVAAADVALTVQRRIAADIAAYVYTPAVVGLIFGSRIVAEAAAYVLAHSAVTLTVARRLTQDTAAYTYTAAAVALSFSGAVASVGLEYTLPTERGHYTLETERGHYTLITERGHYTLPDD